MTKRDIIRAWKDEDYRLSLSEAERSALPEHPAGWLELPDEALEAAAGGLMYSEQHWTIGCCGGGTSDATTCTGGALTWGCCTIQSYHWCWPQHE